MTIWTALKKESKKLEIEGTDPNTLTWPEFSNYRKVCNIEKAMTLSGLQKLLNEVKIFHFQKVTLKVTTPQETPLCSPRQQPVPALSKEASVEKPSIPTIQEAAANDEPQVA